MGDQIVPQPMPYLAEHIQRIATFVDARIDEQLDSDPTRYYDKEDPIARLLRGMRRAVGEMRSRTALVETVKKNPDRPGLAVSAGLTMTFAWGELACIAKEWQDHPDYLPEFALMAHQVEELPVEPKRQP